MTNEDVGIGDEGSKSQSIISNYARIEEPKKKEKVYAWKLFT